MEITIEGIPLKEFSKEDVEYYFTHVNLINRFMKQAEIKSKKELQSKIMKEIKQRKQFYANSNEATTFNVLEDLEESLINYGRTNKNKKKSL